MILPVLSASGVGVAWTLLFGALAVSVAGAARRGRDAQSLSAIAILPGAFVVLLLLAAVLGIVAAYSGVAAWSSRASALAVWFAIMVAAVVVAGIRGGHVSLASGDTPALAVAGAAWLIGVGVAVVRPFETWSRNVSGGTDFNRHLLFIKDIVAEGGLSYSSTSPWMLSSTPAYPRGIHSLVALLWEASSGASYADAWRALEAVAWLIISLLILALAVVATRVARSLGVGRWASDLLAPVIVMMVTLQSMWVTALLLAGFITSIVAGFVLASIPVVALRSRGVSSPGFVAYSVVATAAMAHVWTILAPVTGVAVVCGVGAAIHKGTWRKAPRAHWIAAAAVASIALLAAAGPALARAIASRKEGGVSGMLDIAGDSYLRAPGLLWAAAFLSSLAVFWVARRSASRGWVLVAAMMLLAGLALSAGLFVLSGDSWQKMSYYTLKSLWSMSVLVVPGAVVGAVGAVWYGCKRVVRVENRWRRLAAVALLAAALVVLAAGVAGRLVGTPSKFLVGVRYGMGMIPFQLPVVADLERTGGQKDAKPVLVWGIAPYGSAVNLGQMVALPDWFSREATSWVGLGGFHGDVSAGLFLARDAREACGYLAANPDAVRISGPNPATGAEWMIAAGCPADIVQPSRWIAVPIGDEWFAATPLDGRPYSYPTFEQWRDAHSK